MAAHDVWRQVLSWYLIHLLPHLCRHLSSAFHNARSPSRVGQRLVLSCHTSAADSCLRLSHFAPICLHSPSLLVAVVGMPAEEAQFCQA